MLFREINIISHTFNLNFNPINHENYGLHLEHPILVNHQLGSIIRMYVYG